MFNPTISSLGIFFVILAFHAVGSLCAPSTSFLVNPSRASIPSSAGSQPYPSVSTTSQVPSSLLALRGGGANDEFVGAAYDWCINLGAPAALVAGAVVATLYENIRGGALEVRKGDDGYIRWAKKLTNMLLLSAFALQIVSIFVTTVTGTMLLSRDMSDLKTTSTTALGFLREHFEFEYLTSRLSFLQGILNWLAGVALEHTIPRQGEGPAAIMMDRFVAASLATLVVLLMSFYNAHMTFYKNYFQMVSHWLEVAAKRFLSQARPMMLLYVPGLMLSTYTGVKALIDVEEDYSESISCE